MAISAALDPPPPLLLRKKSKRGRKALPAGQKRSLVISVSCTPEEINLIQRRAKTLGLSVPAYLRACEANVARYGFVESVQKAGLAD